MWLLVALSVLATGNGGIAGAQKSRLTLHPKWVNVFTGDKVTLKCDDPNSPGNITNTKWFRNGSALAIQTPSYSIQAAIFNDSGEYQCQMEGSNKSDLVQLDVSKDWLLLQTSSWVFLEGETVDLRCCSWKAQHLLKVTFYKDQRIMRFYSHNSRFSIPSATHSDSGSYHCTGYQGSQLFKSLPIDITVQGTTSPSSWIHILFFLAMGILFAIDTGLYVTLRRRLCTSETNRKFLETNEYQESGAHLNFLLEAKRSISGSRRERPIPASPPPLLPAPRSPLRLQLESSPFLSSSPHTSTSESEHHLFPLTSCTPPDCPIPGDNTNPSPTLPSP
ncbi:low affinity immunoglobulin gamma Fc region receptor III-like [Tachyglossus aculeatus]|uniref:low affinity immunoglobulin gamma Fc region receptor III-like n=1 Tax=Tachyglossus aculeatus TaxID=9261 RepID=UPI0018F6BEB4|nr:low affinity immunoglobulin gamma Fc region receptor III-like [Tachyglossus aculeatus]